MPHPSVDKSHWIDPQERIEYYLNHQTNFDLSISKLNQLKNSNERMQNEVRFISFSDFKNTFLNWYCRWIMPLPLVRELRALPNYEKYRNLHSLIDFLRPFQRLNSSIEAVKFPVYYGEIRETDELPIIRKSRKITDGHSVLFDLRSLRYNTPCGVVDKQDIGWTKKKHSVIWRGATTGQVTREGFVKNYFDQFNIGFSTVKQKPHLSEYLKPKVSIAEQLQYKFIVSLQGNDLASNIRWVLHSNSVPIMPKPIWTSWTMEDKLKPFVHYLELNDDLSNLEELLEWAKNNEAECQQIALNGRHYVAQFLDRKYDDKVRMQLLEEYSKRVSVIE